MREIAISTGRDRRELGLLDLAAEIDIELIEEIVHRLRVGILEAKERQRPSELGLAHLAVRVVVEASEEIRNLG